MRCELQAAAFSVANLYYNHPILNILAADFGVTHEKASNIPTVMQAGYAMGLLFLCPLGDILKRRAFVLTLTFITASMVDKPPFCPPPYCFFYLMNSLLGLDHWSIICLSCGYIVARPLLDSPIHRLRRPLVPHFRHHRNTSADSPARRGYRTSRKTRLGPLSRGLWQSRRHAHRALPLRVGHAILFLANSLLDSAWRAISYRRSALATHARLSHFQ